MQQVKFETFYKHDTSVKSQILEKFCEFWHLELTFQFHLAAIFHLILNLNLWDVTAYLYLTSISHLVSQLVVIVSKPQDSWASCTCCISSLSDCLVFTFTPVLYSGVHWTGTEQP